MKQQRSGHRCPMTKWQDVSADLRKCLQSQCWPARGAWKHSAAAYVTNYYSKFLSRRCTGLSIRCFTRPCGRTSSHQKGGAGHELTEYFGKWRCASECAQQSPTFGKLGREHAYDKCLECSQVTFNTNYTSTAAEKTPCTTSWPITSTCCADKCRQRRFCTWV